MTTTVAVNCDSGLVMGSESQATAGFYVASNTAIKLYKITDYVVTTISGGLADAQKIVDQIRAQVQLRILEMEKRVSVRSIAKLTSVILGEHRIAPFLAQLIVGGLDDTGAHIFTIDPLGGLIKEKKFAATGSGSPIAYGVLESEYSDEIALEDGVELIKRAITSARKRDIGSGGDFQIVTINEEEGVKFI